MNWQEIEYKKGAHARYMGKTTDDCPHSVANMAERSYWLAGWHDFDIEELAA